ncbi:hypothetical protein OH76DRAFT_1479167 [Lentinus brumalis]|uniref:DUF6534 domain-containing protein n=1 Tax=Lentinus brumalis TaxID=2498619 RepID=A0A371DNK6_9APHY|nr:hypothetical protein OH76DRAFT_1479167 [Polyporus brumalis]
MSSTPATPDGALPPFNPLADLSVVPALDSFLGAWLVGTFASATLQGVLFVQIYSYFRQYPNDPRFVKIWVLVVYFLELVMTVLSMHSCYFYLVTNYLKIAVLLSNIVWSMKIIPVLGGAVTLLTQIFLARRIYVLKRSFRLIALTAVLLTVGLFGEKFQFFWLIDSKSKTAASPQLAASWLASASSCLILAADLMLTFAFIYFLRTNRSGIVSRTNSLLDLLVLYAVSSGLVLCTVNILNVALALPKTLAYSATSLVLTKLYSITFMVWLNAREPLRDRGIIMVETDIFTSVIAVDAQYSSDSAAERTIRSGLFRPRTTSLSLVGLRNLSRLSGDPADAPGDSEKVV